MIIVDSDVMVDFLRGYPPTIKWLQANRDEESSLDAIIGQMAVELNCPLHTFNRWHYEGISNLKIVEPYFR